jgi:hypothetical protein
MLEAVLTIEQIKEQARRRNKALSQPNWRGNPTYPAL